MKSVIFFLVLGVSFSLQAQMLKVSTGACWIQGEEETLTGIEHQARLSDFAGERAALIYGNEFTVRREFKNAAQYFNQLPADLNSNIVKPVRDARRLTNAEMQQMYGGVKLNITGRFVLRDSGFVSVIDSIYLYETDGVSPSSRVYFNYRVGDGKTPSLKTENAVSLCQQQATSQQELCSQMVAMVETFHQYAVKMNQHSIQTLNGPMVDIVMQSLGANRCLGLEQAKAYLQSRNP